MNSPTEIETQVLKPIADLINLVYSGHPKDMRDDLHQTIYLLHYVDADCVGKERIERVVFMLNELGERLQEIEEYLNE